MATLYKTNGLGIRYADGVIYAFSEGDPIQLKRMRSVWRARLYSPPIQDGMGQHGADLDGARRSNRPY